MTRLRRLPPSVRLLPAAVLVLWLAVRLLTPVGFMPSFAGGSLAIVECPDADGAPPAMAMADMPEMDMAATAMPNAGHDHGKNGFHQLCPYAQAASLAGINPGAAIAVALVLLATLSPVARALLVFPNRATRDRPPSRGPPLPA